MCERSKRQRLRIKVSQADCKSTKKNKCVIYVTTVFLTKRKISHNLLHQDTEICFFCNHQNELKEFFSQEHNLVFCNDVCSVIEALEYQHNPNKWCLFTNSLTVTLRAVLLHNGNKFPSVPLAHVINMKESYENIKLLLETIQYEKHDWNVSGFRVHSLLLGLQLDDAKFCRFRCEWDSEGRIHHHIQQQWPT